ncbi:ribose 5-phosphate isomerase A (phosphoriboisomerase a) domain-containing protein [Rhizoctonia solani AG-1 IA]|uniref:Ribose 5-phosphate isomerase A (Phosphoriboisomerase a) domain-containing protein n=1 Tax=Thanatephorus cucumeris (strain AG1-IA) TaxID=983506 RepID=L8WSK1_THACA|nr:ribose 5-phosphate isomerase A (phosphoriboisomerase a) domain-containing protein [Rhizoctonia solani AG-1 IA]
MLTGVVEVGLFCGMAKAAYFGNEDGSVSVRYENGTSDTISASMGRMGGGVVEESCEGDLGMEVLDMCWYIDNLDEKGHNLVCGEG